MTVWLSEDEKFQLLEMLQNQYKAHVIGGATPEHLLKTKLELDAVETATRAAIASENNARYMLWSTIFAALSAFAALGAAVISMLTTLMT